jgi:hypothetical protein
MRNWGLGTNGSGLRGGDQGLKARGWGLGAESRRVIPQSGVPTQVAPGFSPAPAALKGGATPPEINGLRCRRGGRRACRLLFLRCLLALAAALGMVACQSAHTPQTKSALPESGEVPGWEKSSDTRTFTAENLYEYIDGAADKFVHAGLKQTQTADYRFQNKFDATVDIYTMRTPEGAQKMFETESSLEGQGVPVGDLAQLSKSSLIMVKGPHYVKVIAFEESPEVAGALTELGKAIASKLRP